VDLWPDLLQHPAEPPLLLRRSQVPASTWAGLLADAAYRPLTATVALRADAPDDAATRAIALASHIPDRAVLGLRSAAWVHAGGTAVEAPRRLELLVPPGARRVDPTLDQVSHEATLTTDEVVMIGGRRVTTPTRTLLDLGLSPRAEGLRPVLERLCAVGADPSAAMTRLATMPRRPGGRRARALLTTLCSSS